MLEISDLPGEMLMRVMHPLPPGDLKMAVLVSSQWRTMGEHPSLWTWCKVTVRNREDIDNLSIRRLQRIQEICVETGSTLQDGDWEALFHALNTLPSLKKLDL